jgi:glycosyltransferase involved in cell wall biosynthesis
MGGSNLYLPADWLRFVRTLFAIDADVHLIKVPRNLLLPLAAFAKIRRRKVIYVGQRDVDATREGARSADRLPSYLFYRSGLAMVDAVVAQTLSQQRNFLASFGRQAAVIPNVVTLPEEAVAEKSNYVLWVGNSSLRKQPEKFLEVVRALPDISFRMIMAPSNERPDDAFISAQAQGMPNLAYLGFVPFQRIMEEYRGARLFVSTSLSEGFPNTFLQSWQYGTPVVSLHVDPDGVIARHGLGVVPGSLERLVEDVRRLYENTDECTVLSRNSVTYVQNNHSLAAVVDRYQDLFRSLGLQA